MLMAFPDHGPHCFVCTLDFITGGSQGKARGSTDTELGGWFLVLVRRSIRLNAPMTDGSPNMTAEMFRLYHVKDILPEVAATQTDKYKPD